MPLDLWRLVLQQAWQQLEPRPLEASAAWVQWCRLLSSAASTSRTLRAAVLGPGCEPLWAETGFRSAYDGLSQVRLARTHIAHPHPARLQAMCCLQVQSAGLNKLLSRQGSHAHRACIYGGGWNLHLQRAASSLALLDGHLEILGIDDAEEARCLSTALFSCPVASVVYVGSIGCIFPPAARCLVLEMASKCPEPSSGAHAMFLHKQVQAREVWQSWQHLHVLEDLTVTVTASIMEQFSRALVQLAPPCAAHPRLQRMRLWGV